MSEYKTAQIYGLIDPRDKQIHYVGSSVDAIVRLDGHINDGEDTSKTRWIAELKALGLRPEITILAIVPIADRFKEEYKWIYLGKISGWPLTNTAAMKSQKYTDLADGVKDKVFVELDRGLTWDIVKKCLFDVRSLPYPWDIRYSMFASVIMLLVSIVLVSTILANEFISEDFLTFLSISSSLTIWVSAIPLVVSLFKKADVDIVQPNIDDAVLKQMAKEKVEKMIDERMNKLSMELSSWVAETEVHLGTNGHSNGATKASAL